MAFPISLRMKNKRFILSGPLQPSGVQDTWQQNMAPGQTEYFKLKDFETTAEAEKSLGPFRTLIP